MIYVSAARIVAIALVKMLGTSASAVALLAVALQSTPCAHAYFTGLDHWASVTSSDSVVVSSVSVGKTVVVAHNDPTYFRAKDFGVLVSDRAAVAIPVALWSSKQRLFDCSIAII